MGNLEAGMDEEKYVLTMSDGTILELNKSQVEHIDYRPSSYVVFHDGRRILSKGTYKKFDMQYMFAKWAAEWQKGLRTGIGAGFSMGHFFKPSFSVGGGLGLDWHEQVLVPIYAEIGGLIQHRFLSIYRKEGKPGFKVPFTYNIQAGYNLPAGEWISDNNEFEDINGGWMFYPAIGLAFPSRVGNTVRLDVGYKFQRFTRTYEYDSYPAYSQKDVVTLKSFDLRLGWSF